MGDTPWTDLEPQPGDFDAELVTIDPRYVETHRGDPDAKVRIMLTVDAKTPSVSNGSHRRGGRSRRT